MAIRPPARVFERLVSGALRGLGAALPYGLPAVLAALVVAARGPVRSDWRYLGQGSLIMFGGGSHGGLHTYAAFTQLQIGPLSFAVVRGLIAMTAAHAALLTSALVIGLLPAILAMSERAVACAGRPVGRRLVLTAGLLAAPVWAELALRHHLDDALVVAAIAATAWMVASDRSAAAAALAIAGCAAKPWAVIALPMLLALSRRRVLAFVTAAAGAGLVYLPFVVADTGTLHAGRPNVLVSGSSLLRLAGFPVGVIPSAGVRVAQLVVAVVLGVWLARRSRLGWLAVPIAGIATRLLLDPGAFPYYAAGLAGAALLLDMWTGRRVPVVTATALGVWFASYAPSMVLVAVVRTVLLVAVLAFALAVTDRRRLRLQAA